MTDTMNLDRSYIAGTYNRFPVEIVSGKGCIVTDADGKEYIDLTSGIGVTCFGVADEIWQQAVIAQLSKVQHTSNLYYTSPNARLAKLLCEKTGMKKVFFSNSGAESNECAIKVARKWAAENKGPEYSTIITLVNSFHGRTISTLAATGQDHFHQLFQPLTPGFVHTPANDLAAFEALAAQCKPAAVMIECVQGEGGVMALEQDFVRGLAAYAKKENILLIVDEVQTGNGRTGALYSYMNYGVQPDIVSTAKGLGGGLPLGATLLGEKVENTLGPGDHGSTFGGNPVCCAGALSILERLDDDLMAEVREKSKLAFEMFQNVPGVESVSGMGLMIGIKPVKPAREVVLRCIERGVLCLTAKNKIRLLPALNIPTETFKEALEILREVCAE
ncbi:MAG: acetylornithine transaminase [Aristaeellaceae bacterium]